MITVTPKDPNDRNGYTLVSCDKCGNDLEKAKHCECYEKHGYAIGWYDNMHVRVESLGIPSG